MARTDFRSALERTDEIELGTLGRVSGKRTSRPVWFVHHGDALFLLPVGGSDSQWYRNVVADPGLHLTADGAELDTQGEPITDPARVRGVVDDFRAKYGADQVAEYYPKTDVAVQAQLA